MDRSFRLSKTADIKRVRRLGKSYAHPLAVLIVLPNQSNQTRVGVVAGRSVGGAVRRNRAKRVLRAAVSPLLLSSTPGYDLLLLARRPTPEAKSRQVREALHDLFEQADIRLENHKHANS